MIEKDQRTHDLSTRIMKRKKDGKNTRDPRTRKRIIMDTCVELSNAPLNNLKPRDILATRQKLHSWLTRDMVYGKLRRLKKQCALVALSTIGDPEVVDDTYVYGGRPKGSTTNNMLDLDMKKRLAVNRIALLCCQRRSENTLGRLKRNEYKSIHDGVINNLELNRIKPIFEVPWKTINSRLLRKSPTVNVPRNKYSPMLFVEPIILQIVKWKQYANQPITPTEGLTLANSLVEGKEVQENIKNYQRMLGKKPTGKLSAKYWQLFMR